MSDRTLNTRWLSPCKENRLQSFPNIITIMTIIFSSLHDIHQKCLDLIIGSPLGLNFLAAFVTFSVCFQSLNFATIGLGLALTLDPSLLVKNCLLCPTLCARSISRSSGIFKALFTCDLKISSDSSHVSLSFSGILLLKLHL